MRKGEADASPAITGASIHLSLTHDVSLFSSSEEPSNWSGLKTIQRFAEFTVQVSPVIVVDQTRVVAKYHNGRRTGADLIAVVYLGLSSVSAGWWRLPQNCISQNFIEDACRNTLSMRLDCLVHNAIDFSYTLPGFS